MVKIIMEGCTVDGKPIPDVNTTLKPGETIELGTNSIPKRPSHVFKKKRFWERSKKQKR